MIEFLEGKLEECYPTHCVMNVNGVGYSVSIPMTSYERLPQPGTSFRLLTHLIVREDAHLLYGFARAEDRDLFRLLVHHVTGVGPKLALAIVGGMPVDAFKSAVVAGEVGAISKISGIGKKTAERVVLELKDKLGVAEEWRAASEQNAPEAAGERAFHDAVLALLALGYKQADAHRALRKASLAPGSSSDEFVREALKFLA